MKLQNIKFTMTYLCDVACGIVVTRPLNPEVNTGVSPVNEEEYNLKESMDDISPACISDSVVTANLSFNGAAYFKKFKTALPL